ncbi:MAG TPA: ribonuclease Y [Candidatus Paceibacterota bacterium]|nr:ribonuclease Y [Candidatus Paceibacterota bacterium]
MTIFLNPLIAALLAMLAGVAIGYVGRKILASKRIAQAEERAQQVLSDSKSKSQDILLGAKNTALKILEDAKREEKERRTQLSKIEDLLTKKEQEVEYKEGQLISEKETLKIKAEELVSVKGELESERQKQIKELERITGLGREEAKLEIFKKLESEYQEDLYHQLKKLDGENREEIDKKAREILTMAIQRYAGSHIADATTTIVTLPSDELKGKIIGKEGRNIKTIERLTGVDVIIDDTPETLVISGFDPVRRQIGRLAIEKLIADGRIHPAKIEEMVEKAKNEINEKIREAGEAALFETGVGMVDPKLVYLLGRLAFRTSFGQNVLVHSIEMAHVSGMLAAEIGADVLVSKKGALFHDIGKAVDHEVQGTHVEIGRKILQKFSMDERVIRAMEAHHEEYPYSTLESRIVQSADAISGARPGARRDTVEIYLKRLEDLERIAGSFDGVEKSYAIQAGRELRIFVTPAKIDDLSAMKLARDIAKKVESEMKYPGEIKVNVIRETRAIEYAR